jgi:8-oxo-dGTP pyrophosphatase MutT (NUDIX family)
MQTPELRVAARAVVLDPRERILLVRFVQPRSGATWWATPGGALDEGETHEDAVLRELAEEAGIHAPLGPRIWMREHTFPWGDRVVRQVEQYFLVRVESAEVAPEFTPEQLRDEAVHELRWWSVAELEASQEEFAPRRLPELLRQLLETGSPPEPLDSGV